jgi:hypothetical protein
MYVFNKWLCSSSFWKLLLVCCSAFLFFDSVRGFFGKQQLDCIPKEPFIVELLCASASESLSAFQAVQATLLKHRLQTISPKTAKYYCCLRNNAHYRSCSNEISRKVGHLSILLWIQNEPPVACGQLIHKILSSSIVIQFEYL